MDGCDLWLLFEERAKRVASDKAISAHDGELGVGLDSLALVQFVAALEKQFHVEVPDDIWTARRQLTLGDFVEIIAGAEASRVASATGSPQAPAIVQRHAGNVRAWRHTAAGSACAPAPLTPLSTVDPPRSPRCRIPAQRRACVQSALPRASSSRSARQSTPCRGGH